MFTDWESQFSQLLHRILTQFSPECQHHFGKQGSSAMHMGSIDCRRAKTNHDKAHQPESNHSTCYSQLLR